jgi:phage terminase large subunit
MQVAQAERMMELLPLAAATIKLRRAHPVAVPTFRGANMEAQTITSTEWIVGGPRDTGKTFGECWRLDSFARETPRGLFAIVRRVRADFYSTVRKRWEATIRVRGGVETRGGDKPSSYIYANGAEVLVLGLDRDSSVLSGEFDGIYGNQVEEWDLSSWENLSACVTGRGAVTKTPMLFGDCNPGPPGHWILSRPRLKLLHSTHRDNPEIYDDAGNLTDRGRERLAPLEALTGVRRERYLLGKWKQAEGAVYEEFDRSVHVLDRAPICSRHVVSIDFGLKNPFVAQLWGLDGDGQMYLEREIYRTGRIVEDHAKDIKAMCSGKSIEAYVADPADAEGRATLQRHGISTRPAMNAIGDGIQAVQARLGNKKAGIKPRLFVVAGALVERDEDLAKTKRPVCTLDEFESYVWPKDAGGKALKEEPVKVDDHGMDAMRYAVKYVDAGHVDGQVSVVYPRATSSHPTAARVRLF